MESKQLHLDGAELIVPPNGKNSDLRALISGKFRFFFSLDKSKTGPEDLLDSDQDGVPDFVTAHLVNLVQAHRVFTEEAGLPDFFSEGRFAAQGLKFLDIVLDDLPVQRGLASAKVVEGTPPFLEHTPYTGPSILIKLHRSLPTTSLTPAHELFHIFQYATIPFLNMWFMEGLARHGQRWLARTKPESEALPRTQAALERVLRMWHDAEGFWNRLAALCTAQPSDASPSKEQDGVVNPYMPGQRFLGAFFRHCVRNVALMVAETPARALSTDWNWSLAQRRSGANNRYILKAISGAVREIQPPPHPELEAFLWLIENQVQEAATLTRSPQVQDFLRVLRTHRVAVVSEDEDGLLSCPDYDAATGTLSVAEIRFAKDSLTNAELDTFVVCRHIIGNLHLANQPRLDSLDGLNELRAVDGSIIVHNTGAVRIAGGFRNLERVKGKLEISQNPRLQQLVGFNQLVSIDTSLEITSNPGLTRLVGFRNLEEIKKGALRVHGSTELKDIAAFTALIRVREIDLARLGIRSLGFLRSTIQAAPDFPGPIRVTHCQVEDIAAFQGLRSVASSFYLHGNRLTHVDDLSSLTSVNASLSLSDNRLVNLHGLRQLKRINGMLGLGNNRLRSLKGLESLISLQTTVWGGVPLTLVLRGNAELTDISALANVATPDDYLIAHFDDIGQYRIRPQASSRFHRNMLQLHQGKDKAPVPTYLWCKKPSHDYANFRRTTHNRRLTYIQDFEQDADTLLLSFAGLDGKLGGIFHDHFSPITEGTKTHKIFISDPTNRWYHGGIPGLTGSMQETLAYLQTLTNHRKYRRIFCIGVSMGGYMALLAGHQLGATDIIALSPQTFIDDDSRLRYGDTRWAEMLGKLPTDAPADFLDLAALYAKGPRPGTRIQIHYAGGQALERAHVEHLQAVVPLEAIQHDTGTYTVSLHLERIPVLCPKMGPTWTKNMGTSAKFRAHSIEFESASKVIDYALQTKTEVIFPTTVPAIKFMLKNRPALVGAGLKFICPSAATLNRLTNKGKFYDAMKLYGFGSLIPAVYEDKAQIRYPCIVKLPMGSGGKGQEIIENESQLENISPDAIYMEYVEGRTEYAANILIVRERVIYAQTFEKRSSEDHYILGVGNQQYSKVPSHPTNCDFLDIFEKILCAFGCEGFYCIDYKVDKGKPKIFEINPRMGFTNTMFPALLDNSISAYFSATFNERMDCVSEIADENGLRYVVKRYEQCAPEELNTFITLAALARGSRPANLPNIVQRCLYMVFAYHEQRIVGISGVKIVPESRAWDKAGCAEYRAQYPYEFGFLYVDEGWRRRGVSRKLIELSLECVDSSKVFLVTHNPHVIGAFSGRGFLRAGRPYGAKNWWLLRAPNESSATEVTPKKCTESSNKAAPVLG